ncbi:dienelactone hydrolase family protein [Paucibacter sp. APW11]|uniref:Dienelactone hydrolase family protein n=1 Tax=Roseateles aquae TaxID=3077235 RepID=A0ABU3PIQ1_9BURK|nr:dienelactone hydrolase family protein [Paucibacter sp. APW11]MDT9002002.1 dienelactone hydrolase family protein [Paucibacter sp. APW11]
MPQLSAQDFSPAILKLFDQYVHGDINRRGFLDQAQRHVGSAAAALATLTALTPRFAEAQQVKPDDARIKTRIQEFDSPAGNGKVRGLLAWPAAARGKLPVVLVVHENRGLNPHIEDIARRLAVDGFIAFAPDALFTLGGYPGDEDKARELFPKLDAAKTRADFVAAARALQSLPEGNGRVGVVGFCFGGGVANYLATQIPDLAAAVPFYGAQPPAAEVAKIKAPLLIHYAGNDERINAGWPAYEQALKAAGVSYEAHVYEGTQHGFNNDTTPRFDAKAAGLAWARTIGFFKARLA